MAMVFLFSTLQYVNIEYFGQLFLTLDPVWIMEHNFFTTQSRLCRAEAEHRALSLKSLKICKSSKSFAKASTNKIVGSFCINRDLLRERVYFET